MTWTGEMKSAAEALRQQGMSFTEIGRELGVSKNSVVGMSHRENWPASPRATRPVPECPNVWTEAEKQILRDNFGRPNCAIQPLLPGRSIPAIETKRRDLRAVEDWSAPAHRHWVGPALTTAPVLAAPLPPPVMISAPPPVPMPPLPQVPLVVPPPPKPRPFRRQCQWLEGDSPRFFQCMVLAVGGSGMRADFCAEHYRRSVVRPRREEAA